MRQITARIAVALSLVSVLPALAAAQEFEGAVTMKVDVGGMMNFDIVSLAKGSKVRQEMSMMGQEMVSIVDQDAMTALTLMPSQRTYMKLDMRALAAQAPVDTMPPTVTAIGTTDTIVGHACQNYTVAIPEMTMQMCIATDLGYYMGSLNGQGGSGASPGLQAQQAFIRQKFPEGFFPLRTTVTAQGQSMTMEVTKIEPKSLSDDLFKLDIPEGYTEIQMPGRGPGTP